MLHLGLIYSAQRRHQTLLGHLDPYTNVTVRRNIFPLPHVYQLSLGRGVTDSDVTAILRLEGLQQVTNLYLDNSRLTDACLDDAATITELSYLFIDCQKITDDAILRFESQFPDCRDVPYRRNLHGAPTVFLGIPEYDE